MKCDISDYIQVYKTQIMLFFVVQTANNLFQFRYTNMTVSNREITAFVYVAISSIKLYM